MRFQLGQLVATPGAVRALGSERGVLDLVWRHANGDWGDLGDEDRAANERALRDGDHLLSRYDLGGDSFYVVTEHDRSYTTVMLVEEY